MKVYYAKAEFTVEASLLMTIILPLLVTLLTMGFFMHDRACMQGAACETAAMGSNLKEYDDQAVKVQLICQNLMKHRALWTKSVGGSGSADQKQAEAVYTGNFTFPTMVGRFWGGGGRIERSWWRTIYDPGSLIRKMRGAKYLWDTVTGNEKG